MDKYTGQNMSKQEEEIEMEREGGPMACNIYNKLRFDTKFCDALIKVDGAEFHAHKIILSGCSPFFMALFSNCLYPPDKYEYSIPGISPEIMELIMEYAYTQHDIIMEENVCELLIAADYLLMSDLVNKCSMFLKTQLCVENCISIWHFAHSYFFQKLKQEAFQFILRNFEDIVCVSEEFLDLTVEDLSEIIENDELNVKQERVVFEAILQWIKHVPQNRKSHMEVLLPKVRMLLLRPNYFIDNVRNNTFVAKNDSCKIIISSVLKSMNDPNESLHSELKRPRLPSAVLLAIGGKSNGGHTNAIEAYDTRAESWVNVTCNEESPQVYHKTVFLNGFVYCIGRYNDENNLSRMRRFDPITRTWAQVSPMHSRRSFVSVCVLDGCIYAMGGFDGHECLNAADRYEPETNQWRMIEPMNARRSNASATALEGKLYICGGFDGNECLFTAECYSSQTDQWTLIAPMRSRRYGLGVMAYGGQVYAVGGYDGVNDLRSAEVYNPQTNSWRDIPAMINQRFKFGIEVMDDLLFVAGGRSHITKISNVECYDQKTDKWSAVKDMGISRHSLSCCVISGLPNMAQYAAPRDEVPHSSGNSGGILTTPVNI